MPPGLQTPPHLRGGGGAGGCGRGSGRVEAGARGDPLRPSGGQGPAHALVLTHSHTRRARTRSHETHAHLGRVARRPAAHTARSCNPACNATSARGGASARAVGVRTSVVWWLGSGCGCSRPAHPLTAPPHPPPHTPPHTRARAPHDVWAVGQHLPSLDKGGTQTGEHVAQLLSAQLNPGGAGGVERKKEWVGRGLTRGGGGGQRWWRGAVGSPPPHPRRQCCRARGRRRQAARACLPLLMSLSLR